MRLPHKTLASIVYLSFKKAFEERNRALLKNDNPFRSAYFVNLIGKELAIYFKDAKTNYQAVDSIFNKSKSSGEWLFDICVTTQAEIIDERKEGRKSKINTNILLACESEFETNINAFTTDFGKLICSNANQKLFIQGLNQKTKDGREDFIISRQEIVKTQLQHLISDDFVLAFIPTPGKIGNQSYWDENEKEVLSWSKIFVYDASKNDFEEIKM